MHAVLGEEAYNFFWSRILITLLVNLFVINIFLIFFSVLRKIVYFDYQIIYILYCFTGLVVDEINGLIVSSVYSTEQSLFIFPHCLETF